MNREQIIAALKKREESLGGTTIIYDDIADLMEALDFYSNGMSFGYNSKGEMLELQSAFGLARVVYAGNVPALGKPPLKLGTFARETLDKFAKKYGIKL